jgi:hypothetical protein
VVAKRFDKENRVLLEFALTDEKRWNSFDRWCNILINEAFQNNPELRALTQTAKDLGRERNSLFHGNWVADKATGKRQLLFPSKVMPG